MRKLKRFLVLSFTFTLCALSFAFAQDADLEFTLDTTSETVALPKIFKPNIDLSGRGFNREVTWPQTVADKKVLEAWQKDIGFKGIYRLQYSFWEISDLSRNKGLQEKLLANYESIIKSISDSGGIVIVDLFGTPEGSGRVLDTRSPPRDLRQYKELIKNTIRELSCIKKYNIWYEVWNSPDSDEFFIGKWQEYLNVYRFAGEAVKELEHEYKMHIPLGGPGVSWWYQNTEGNTIITPESSLIYELIRYAYHYRMPLDFISWHGYSSDPELEKVATVYKQTAASLLRNWLSYFRQDKNIPLIVDEWNFDRNANVLPERSKKSYIAASYIPSRIKNMYQAGIDYQLYFCLEDFQGNKEGVVRNVGIFSFDPEHSQYKGEPKAMYNVFKMLNTLGRDMFAVKLSDEFAGAIATKTEDGFVFIIYNYIDPDIVNSSLFRNICSLNSTGRKILLNLIRSNRLNKVLAHEITVESLGVNRRLRALLNGVVEANDKANKFSATNRTLKITLKNLKEDHLYQRYTVDPVCAAACEFKPVEEKDISATNQYQETLILAPYSVHMIVLKIKPKEPGPVPVAPAEKAEEKK